MWLAVSWNRAQVIVALNHVQLKMIYTCILKAPAVNKSFLSLICFKQPPSRFTHVTYIVYTSRSKLPYMISFNFRIYTSTTINNIHLQQFGKVVRGSFVTCVSCIVTQINSSSFILSQFSAPCYLILCLLFKI